jgi:hypothetical protein
MERGGKREGAGRKPTRGERKETLALRVTPTLRAFLDVQEPSISEFVESFLRQSRRFRDWQTAHRAGH